jgi:hypothetical protein
LRVELAAISAAAVLSSASERFVNIPVMIQL